MGVDTKVYLPASVQISDVADVIAILLGLPRTWTDSKDFNRCIYKLTEPTEQGWCAVDGISYDVENKMPYCVTIKIEGAQEKFGGGWWFFYR